MLNQIVNDVCSRQSELVVLLYNCFIMPLSIVPRYIVYCSSDCFICIVIYFFIVSTIFLIWSFQNRFCMFLVIVYTIAFICVSFCLPFVVEGKEDFFARANMFLYCAYDNTTLKLETLLP